MENKKDWFNFGDLVEYEDKLYRFIGMTEDGEVDLVRMIDEHAFECVDFEPIYYDDFDKIKLVERSPIKEPFPDSIPYESFTDRFCREHNITNKELKDALEFVKESKESESKKNTKFCTEWEIRI